MRPLWPIYTIQCYLLIKTIYILFFSLQPFYTSLWRPPWTCDNHFIFYTPLAPSWLVYLEHLLFLGFPKEHPYLFTIIIYIVWSTKYIQKSFLCSKNQLTNHMIHIHMQCKDRYSIDGETRFISHLLQHTHTGIYHLNF